MKSLYEWPKGCWLRHDWPTNPWKLCLVQKRELLLFICIEKGQVATDVSWVGNGCVSWGPRWWELQVHGAVLCDLPCSRACAWELPQNTEIADSARKGVKGHISLWHLAGLDGDFYAVIHYCWVNIILKTYYAVFYWVCLKPDSFTNSLFLL